MLPGKHYTPEEILNIVVSRAWLIVVPLALATATAVVVAQHIPKKYRSETLVMLMPQRIPETYVKAAATNPADLLATLQDQLLSRSRLERIIVDLNLYESLRQKLPMEDVVLRMRSDISLETEGKDGKESPTFRILYISDNAKTAQKATERLASLFIEENLRDRENVSEDTSQFLDSQLQDARQRLLEQEKRLEEYRRKYSGQLPTQVTSNLQAIQNAQLQLQSLREATDRARERRLLLEHQLADLSTPDPLANIVSAPGGQGSTPSEGTATQQLNAARARLQQLQTRYKPDHPDIVAMQRLIRDLEARVQAERSNDPATPRAPSDLTPTEAARQKRLRDTKDEMDSLDREIADKQHQETVLAGVISDYQAKLEAVPARESDLVELMRDHDTLQSTYQNLLAKREESKLATNLERRNSGEQFRVLDPARVPERPFSPNVQMITLGGSAAGFAIGLALIAFLEFRDSSFKTEDDVVRLCQLPVLALVPLMATRTELKSSRRRLFLGHAAAVFAVIVSAAVIAGSVLHVF